MMTISRRDFIGAALAALPVANMLPVESGSSQSCELELPVDGRPTEAVIQIGAEGFEPIKIVLGEGRQMSVWRNGHRMTCYPVGANQDRWLQFVDDGPDHIDSKDVAHIRLRRTGPCSVHVDWYRFLRLKDQGSS